LCSIQKPIQYTHIANIQTGQEEMTSQTGRINWQEQDTLTDDQKLFFQENGYLIVDNGVNKRELDELKSEAVAVCRGNRGDFTGILDLSPDLTDDEVIRHYLCIHFPHKLSPIMKKYLAHPVIKDVLTGVIGPDVKCMQSMLFVKSAGKPGQAWHQDENYIPTRDRSLTGAWIAIDDATTENGCLWVIPKSHRPGVIFPSESTDNPDFDCAFESKFSYDESTAIPVEVKAGSIVFFNGYLLHRSLPNRAKSGFRRVLVNHYMSASSMLPWGGTIDYRDIEIIAGVDPYAYKGIEDLAKPHLRSTGEGGCANGTKKQLTGKT
jgi:ectoine hydroxylase-related dioxygenase (phytanoyl-CoA dioxygenase family)